MATRASKPDIVLHQLERLLDHQVQALDALGGRTGVLLGLAIGLIAGGIALLNAVLGGFSRPVDAGGHLLLVVIVLGILATGASVLLFLQGSVGLTRRSGRRFESTPEAGWLVAMALDPDWSADAVIYSLMRGYRRYAASLDKELARVSGLHRCAVLGILAALTAYSAAIVLRVVIHT